MTTRTLTELLRLASMQPDQEQRKIAALVGACVADAAARPLHWVYDMEALEKYLNETFDDQVDRTKQPEFYPENKSPFYSLPTGENSCYFDITLASLESLKSGGYDHQKLCEHLEKTFFGDNSSYDLEKRNQFMELRKNGLGPNAPPVQGKWMHGALLKFHENYSGGKRLKFLGDAEIKETDGFCAALPVILKQSGTKNVTAAANEVVRTLSNYPASISHGVVAAKIMEKIITSKQPINKQELLKNIQKEVKNMFPDVESSLHSVFQHLETDHFSAVTHFGRQCYNPGSFQGAIHAYLSSDNFEDIVRQTIKAGGCNCSRALFAGAMAGATYGINGIPIEWMRKTRFTEVVLENCLIAL